MEANQMTFGCEIECAIPYIAMQQAGWTVGAYHVGARLAGFPGWKAMRDGSLRNFAPDMQPVEIVSPVLRGAEGLAEVGRMVAQIRGMGGKVNTTCGFHVHVGFGGDVKALVRLIYLTANVETALFASTGSRARIASTYCKPVKDGYSRVQNPGKVDTLDKLQAKESRVGDRYHSLNLCNLITNARPTVEFRVFQGTLNFTKISAYVQIAVGLVHVASDRKARTPWTAPMRPNTFPGGAGESEVRRLFAILGWTRHYAATRSEATKNVKYGALDHDTLRSRMRMVVQLARKHDGGDRRSTVTDLD